MKSTIKLLPGKIAFKMVDEIGFPFDMLLDELKDRNLGIDIEGFINCALDSKNWNVKRIKQILSEVGYSNELLISIINNRK